MNEIVLIDESKYSIFNTIINKSNNDQGIK